MAKNTDVALAHTLYEVGRSPGVGEEFGVAAWTVHGRVIFCAPTRMPDLGDQCDYSTTNWSIIDYVGDGLFLREEDISNPAHFGTLLTEWQRAKEALGTE